MTIEKMNLGEWLKRNKIKIGEFSKRIGCHRQTLRYANRGIPICTKTALAIKIETKGQVDPIARAVGRPKKL